MGDAMSTSDNRTSVRPISFGVTATVFFAGSVLLWADRTNFSVAAAAWAKEYAWKPATIGMMLSAFSLGYLFCSRLAAGSPRKPGRAARWPARWPVGRCGCY